MHRRERHRLALLIGTMTLAFLANLLSTSCTIRKPQAPSWLSTWELPLINKAYGVVELLDKIGSSSVVVDENGDPGIRITQNLDTVLVSESFAFEGLAFDVKDSVGIIEIETPSDINITTSLSSIAPSNIGVIPPVSFDVSQPLQTVECFTWASVDHGVMNLTFTNRLEIDLDAFVVTVIDSADMHVVGVLPYDQGLSYMETETQSLEISGQTISNRLLMVYHGQTPGGVLINAGPQTLDATASFPSRITVRAARAETPEIRKVKSETHFIDDSTKVYSSVISQGTLQFDILNQTDLPFSVTLHSGNFKLNDADFLMSRQLTPHDSMLLTIDLAGYTFSPSDSFPLQCVTVDMVNTVPPSTPAQYTVRASDSLKVHVDISDIVFDSLTGRIEPTPVTVEPAIQWVNLPDGLEHARLIGAQLTITLVNNSTVPANVDLVVEGGSRSIPLSGRVAPKSSAQSPPQVTALTVGPDLMADFLSPPPDRITISGTGTVNPDYEIVTIRPGDSFTGEMVISSAFSLALPDTATVEPKTSGTSIDGNSRPDNYRETVESGIIDATFENHLPLGAILTMFVGTRGDSLLYSDQSTIVLGPYALASAVTGADGHVIGSISSSICDSLDAEQLGIFDNDSVYFGQRITLLPTDSAGVEVSGNDFFGVSARARIRLRFGSNLWSDNKGGG